MTREDYLHKLIEAFRPMFVAAGSPVPEKVRASCGWPSSRALSRKHRTIGECWPAKASADETHEVLISPALGDAVEVSHVLVHELCHSAMPPGTGHKGPFVRLARTLGLVGKPTATTAGPELLKRIQEVLATLPPYPHARLDANFRPVKKQSTRMAKLFCHSCGYVARATSKWISTGLPTCPCGTEMETA